MIRIPYAELRYTIERALLNAGLDADQAALCASVHADSSRDGVNSHGLNRIPRFVDYVRQGWVHIGAEPLPAKALGAIEIYDGQQGIGVTNAIFATERAMALAAEQGHGLPFTHKSPLRATQFVLGKTPFTGKSGALFKNGNTVEGELGGSLRAGRQGAIRCVAFSRRRPATPSKMRRAADPLATR